MTAEISDLTHLRRGALRLAGGMSVCTYLFPALLKEHQRRYPNIELTIATGTNDEILHLLRTSQVDVALLSLPFNETDLEVHPALTEEMVLVMERNHQLAKQEKVTFKDLTSYPFIHFERGANTRKLLDQIFSEKGVRFRNSMELPNVEITKPLVEIGLGISIISFPAVAKDIEKRTLCYRRIGGRKIYRELGWVFLKSDYSSRTLKQLLGLLEEVQDQLAPSNPDDA